MPKYKTDESHCHCIDCGKLFVPERQLEDCDRCGGLIDFCDSRCKNLKLKKELNDCGIYWQEYEDMTLTDVEIAENKEAWAKLQTNANQPIKEETKE